MSATRIYASTTFLPGRTRLADALAALDGLGLDGVELGSTHFWQEDLVEVVAACPLPKLCHNYFPAARDDLIINLASLDDDLRRASLDHALSCLDNAAAMGAALYTVHPGFVADATGNALQARPGLGYDFTFSERRTPRHQAVALMEQSLSVLVARAAEKGIGLAVETEGSVTHRDLLLLETPEEYRRLFQVFPKGLGLNLNLAHSAFAARVHGFDLGDFVAEFTPWLLAAELSDNDGSADQHRPLRPGCATLTHAARLPDIPLILEFRDASRDDLQHSAALVRAARKEAP